MIRMQQVKLPVEAGEAAIKNKVCHLLKARESDVRRIEIRRRSLDARKKFRLRSSAVWTTWRRSADFWRMRVSLLRTE